MGSATGEAELEAFRKGVAQGQRSWVGLTLPWDADLRGLPLGGCKGFAGVKLDGAAVRQLYSLILLTRPDDPEVVRALEILRAALAVPLDQRIMLADAEVLHG
jgi:hypothetical protein